MKRFATLCCAALLAVFCCFPTAGAAERKSFSDVKPKAWYYGVVTEMTGRGLLQGYKDGSFRPENTISFAEFVAIAARCRALPAASPGSHWAAGNMGAALAAGWYDWDECPPDNTSRWDAPISRQVAAKILMKAFAPEAHGEYSTWAGKISDFSQLDGRYYDAVFAAYETGVFLGDKEGGFRPRQGLSRAESCAVISRALALGGSAGEQPEPPAADTVGVSENGWLQVKGAQLCNEKGEAVLLRGVSSHGLQWYSQFASKGSIASAAAQGANVFRAAMYTAEGGYIADPQGMKRKLIAAVDAALALDLYVIIDWHILSDGSPGTYTAQAKAFFSEISQRYKDQPGVLYEICNEPNGGVSWSDVAHYANQVIPVIRKNSPRSVILCGSPTWSQDIHLAAQKPLNYQNVIYTFHFYAGTHGQALRDRVASAHRQGLPIFVSEWGTSDASGSGGVYLPESKAWLDFLEAQGISWVNWSLCDKGESSAALLPGANPSGWTEKDLSPSGRFVFDRIKSSN